MLAANETVAKHFADLEIPFIYRVHPDPDPEKLASLVQFLGSLGYTLKWRGRIRPKHLQAVLRQAEGKPEEHLIAGVVLRSLQRARYSPENEGHFGLAATDYTHFTSPIRRYPDLQIHRIIKEYLSHGGLSEARREHYRKLMPAVAAHSSEMERRAEEAERETVDLKKIEFMEGRLGEVFSGVISGVTAFGFFVELPNGVEGLVRVSDLSDDYYIYDEKAYRLVGERTRRQFRLADPVRVKVLHVDKERRRIDFELLEGGTMLKKAAVKHGGRRRR